MKARSKSFFEEVQIKSEPCPAQVNTYDIVTEEQTVDEYGRVLKKSVIKTVNSEELNAGLKVSDFYLENLIAAGSFDSLKEVGTINSVGLDAIDSIESGLHVLDGMEVEE